MRYCLMASLLLAGIAHADSVETVFTLADDLQHASRQFKQQAEQRGEYGFLFDLDVNPAAVSQQQPADYQWQHDYRADDGKQYRRLLFRDTRDYGYLQQIDNQRDGFLTVDDSQPGRYYLRVDASRCQDGCRYQQSTVSVVLPARLRVLGYIAQVDQQWLAWGAGDWQVAGNRYTFQRRDLSGSAVFLHLEERGG